jgi:hypothetical protein
MVTIDGVLRHLGRPPAMEAVVPARLTPAALSAASVGSRWFIANEDGRPPVAPPEPFPLPPGMVPHGLEFKAAVVAQARHLERALAAARRAETLPVLAPLDRAQLLLALSPQAVFTGEAEARVSAPPDAPPRGALDPVRGTPRFPEPVVDALRAISERHILPGLEHVPANTSSLLRPNAQFVEAFLVGMNHEMERELLWREFPCLRGGTFFRRFWDTRARLSDPDQADIPEIAEWTLDSALGAHQESAAVKTVLLIRGDLVRRFPGIVLYSVPATAGGAPDLDPTKETHPVLTGGLDPDVLYAGFEFPPEDAALRFFVLQQRPAAPRFGLDAQSEIPAAAVTLRDDLAWTHMAPGASHATAAGVLAGRPLVGSDPSEQAIYGRTSADMAFATLQLPVRVVFRGREMLP